MKRNGPPPEYQLQIGAGMLGCLIVWGVLFLLTLMIVLAFSATANAQEPLRPSGRMIPGPTYTPTPEPDPCADCPEPGTPACELWPGPCYQCWENCGNPQATPTPTQTPTPYATPTPTPNGPACELYLPSGGTVYLIAYYAHESKQRGTVYQDQHGPVSVARGVMSGPIKVLAGANLRPCPCEGHPVGFEWLNGVKASLKKCGNTTTVYPPTPTPTPGPVPIFADGFETGDTSAWSATVGGE